MERRQPSAIASIAASSSSSVAPMPSAPRIRSITDGSGSSSSFTMKGEERAGDGREAKNAPPIAINNLLSRRATNQGQNSRGMGRRTDGTGPLRVAIMDSWWHDARERHDCSQTTVQGASSAFRTRPTEDGAFEWILTMRGFLVFPGTLIGRPFVAVGRPRRRRPLRRQPR